MENKPPLTIETKSDIRPDFDLGSPITPSEPVSGADHPSTADVQAALPHIARQYTRYLRVNTSEETKALDGQLDTILGRLDEVKNQFEIIKGVRESHSESLTKLKENTHKLESLFNQIDQMEKFLQIVQDNMTEIESKVIQAEKELGNNLIVKALGGNPLNLIRRKPREETEDRPKWDPPRVTITDQFFDKNIEAINPHII
ncbi:hypothetical protein LOD99_6947 [Oopsacas minuta]|uniref:Biogenesis of lysosome-related organelles complex 1 subunit 4 n=1 Tax=Oopsacas minuta TaxID=111878 RepID=A0AAV7JJ60_9METZ|nr:hypothetical protein LOD99_6947 [Oopsacas minuta]